MANKYDTLQGGVQCWPRKKKKMSSTLDQIDFHGMTAEELNKSSMTSRLLTEIFIAKRLKQNL